MSGAETTRDRSESFIRERQSRFCSLIFVSPFATRTAAQIQFPSSTDRSSLRARTRAPTCDFEHRGRAGRVPSQSRACPFGVPAEAARTDHSRLSLGAVVPGLPEPEEHMTHGDPARDAHDGKTTAVTIGRSPTGACDSIGVETDDCAPTLNSASQSDPTRIDRQVRLTEFGFVPASQL